uniref:MRN complex interacting protein n=1 Tax=Lepisosteus oculatus TaxID=7918 RepID=W5N0C8_LEPOC|nr:PREDICTED: UPF0544 protein C5orf45 homolog [Lepisosteus oculatus]
MVQEFQVLRCFTCKTFQVHQVKKSNKWNCKMCGEKQSLMKIYGQGSGADCRRHVQKLNAMRGEIIQAEEDHACEQARFSEDIQSQDENLSIAVEPNVEAEKEASCWSNYLQDSTEESREETTRSEEDNLYTDSSCFNVQNVINKTSRKRKKSWDSANTPTKEFTNHVFYEGVWKKCSDQEKNEKPMMDERRSLTLINRNSKLLESSTTGSPGASAAKRVSTAIKASSNPGYNAKHSELKALKWDKYLSFPSEDKKEKRDFQGQREREITVTTDARLEGDIFSIVKSIADDSYEDRRCYKVQEVHCENKTHQISTVQNQCLFPETVPETVTSSIMYQNATEIRTLSAKTGDWHSNFELNLESSDCASESQLCQDPLFPSSTINGKINPARKQYSSMSSLFQTDEDFDDFL